MFGKFLLKRMERRNHSENKLKQNYYLKNNPKVALKKGINGAGGVPDLEMVKIELSIVLDRGEPQLPDAFYRIKKYWS